MWPTTWRRIAGSLSTAYCPPTTALSFYNTLVAAVRLVMQALFAMHGVYYPGDKWQRQAILRFGLDQRVLAAYARLWAPSAATARIAAYRELLELAGA